MIEVDRSHWLLSVRREVSFNLRHKTDYLFLQRRCNLSRGFLGKELQMKGWTPLLCRIKGLPSHLNLPPDCFHLPQVGDFSRFLWCAGVPLHDLKPHTLTLLGSTGTTQSRSAPVTSHQPHEKKKPWKSFASLLFMLKPSVYQGYWKVPKC